MSNDTRGSEPETKPESTDAELADTKLADTEATEPADADNATGAEKAESDAADSDDFGVRRSPALIATAVALPVALVVGVLVMGVLANRHHSRDPLALGAVPAPAASSPECSALLPALPGTIGDYTTSELMQPAPPATKAWQLPDGGDPIVVRCGLDRPQEFTKASPLQVVNGVNWFEVRDQTSGVTSGTWWAVDRGTYIALTQPDNAGATPLQEVSDAITKAIPAKPIDPNPIPN
ncbi:DUF3515 domain-containing protein [Nocardia sp. CDC160]|uniref:DUF3515 domain-containing protein n=1 Tax=Nocardia sp. CDC160 TaxID=3112166 RepID=UPI002DBC3275|nr:DUF3515 domain-containing protein [Nocardia sp. CDC160]MEC3915111.1 DUF3515 domain-containing protein [Nocardia sp. CDC160]